MCSCGSVTVWTHWDRFGQPAAGIRWTVTTAAALMDSSSAPITAARPPARGAPGPVGRHAACPVGRDREPDTGEGKETHKYLKTLIPTLLTLIPTLFLCHCCVSGLWSQRLKEQIASLRKSSINPATQDPALLSVSMTTRSSEWVTPGCRASVNNGETDAQNIEKKYILQ